MIYEELTCAQFAPSLAGSSTAVLHTYARPKQGFLAEDGGRWGVIILPGGGYHVNAPSEAEPIALSFLGAGVQAFLLEYSVVPARWPQALLETAAAIAWLREHAQQYGVAPDKIAVCGFSAGGHLAGCTANLWGSEIVTEKLGITGEQARPDAAILCYPVVTMALESGTRSNLFADGEIVKQASLECSVTDRNPPTFIWATCTDASVPVANSMLYATALNEHSVPFELHIFNRGPHAMGLATPNSADHADHTDERAACWHPLCISWLNTL